MLLTPSITETELLAVAMQFYVRLRRINGRVIDVQYMMENREYASHIIKYAENIIDVDLQRHLNKIKDLCDPKEAKEAIKDLHQDEEKVMLNTKRMPNDKATWFLG